MSIRIKTKDQVYIVKTIADCKSEVDKSLFNLVMMFKGFAQIGNSFAIPE